MTWHHAGKSASENFRVEDDLYEGGGRGCVMRRRWPGSGSPRDDYDDVDRFGAGPVQHSGFSKKRVRPSVYDPFSLLNQLKIRNATTRMHEVKAFPPTRKKREQCSSRRSRCLIRRRSAGSKVGPESRGEKARATDILVRDTAVARLTWRCGPSPRRR